MSANKPPWYVEFFGEDYRLAYRSTLTDERSDEETAFAAWVLGLSTGQEILDLCCGHGRHAVRLAEAGMKVTGLDLSEEYLAEARATAAMTGVALELVRSDMRHIPFAGRFDAVINMFSAFGYLESESDDQQVLQAIYEALKPGGSALMDLINREWVVANNIENEWHVDEDGTTILEHRELDLLGSRNHVSFSIIGPDGIRRESVGHKIRLYTLTEIASMLGRAGLAIDRVFGGYDAVVYSSQSRRMIVVAKKPE